jgi:hypothetical protein
MTSRTVSFPTAMAVIQYLTETVGCGRAEMMYQWPYCRGLMMGCGIWCAVLLTDTAGWLMIYLITANHGHVTDSKAWTALLTLLDMSFGTSTSTTNSNNQSAASPHSIVLTSYPIIMDDGAPPPEEDFTTVPLIERSTHKVNKTALTFLS